MNLLVFAIVILLCIILNKISSKIGLPKLLVFIALGIIFGKEGLFQLEFQNYNFAKEISVIALIFIMFYGGFGTKWIMAKPVVLKSAILSTFGVLATSFTTSFFCYYILGINASESFLIGAVISSTDAASVFSILRSNRLNLKYNTASMLELESGSNDPFSYMLTFISLSLIGGTVDSNGIINLVINQIVIAIIVGITIAFITHKILDLIYFESEGMHVIFVFAIALISYSLPDVLGGNGFLSSYIVGIYLGNNRIRNKRQLVHFFDGVTGLFQMIIFFLLGLIASPSKMIEIMPTGISIAFFITFIARPITVFLFLTPFKSPLNKKVLVSWSGLRGAASIVFAIFVIISDSYIENDIFHIVFVIVLFSLSLQGSLIPFLSKKLSMIDDSNNVMKTFNDYSEEVDVQFIKLIIKNSHPWKNKAIRDINIAPGLLLVLIIRDDHRIIPKGDTILQKNDLIVFSASAYEDHKSIKLSELIIDNSHPWLNRNIGSIKYKANRIIILIKRNDEVVIPRGDTIILEKDTLIINEYSKNY